MKNNQSYYLNKIKEGLSVKQRNNTRYSLRAYARDIGVHPSTLSQVIKGKRDLPYKNAKGVIEKLNLDPREKRLFMESLLKTKIKLDQITINENEEQFILDESYHKIISEWEHYAVLELFHISGFNAKVGEISNRIDISENRAEIVLNNLLKSGLLKESDGKLIRTEYGLRTTEDVKSQALKKSHLEALELGKNKLEEIEVDLRDFSSMTVALDINKVLEAKVIIREFRQKMSKLLREGNKTDVYQLAIQFYPLTKIKSKQIT